MLIANLKDGLPRWRVRERAWRELSQLDDRQLADIGLNRADIPAVVYGRESARG